MNSWDEEKRQAILSRIPLVEGKSVVNIGSYEAEVFPCRRISGLRLDEDSFYGQCDWIDPPELRPDELTEGMAISCDGLRLGPGWWQDTYFGWYFIHDPELVARSIAGDQSWVEAFLASVQPSQIPGPSRPPILADHLRPAPGEVYWNTEEVLDRLRGAFSFFQAIEHLQPASSAGNVTPAGNGPAKATNTEGRFTVVAADDHGESTNYISFELRPRQEILVGYRDQDHLSAVKSLTSRCAELLGYEIHPR